MSKSSENSKKGSSKEINKVVGRLKYDRFNSSEGARTQDGTFVRAYVLRKTYVLRMKNLKLKKPTNDSELDTDEDWRTFIRSGGWTAIKSE